MQQNDKSVVSECGNMDFVNEDKSSVISECEGIQEQVQFHSSCYLMQ